MSEFRVRQVENELGHLAAFLREATTNRLMELDLVKQIKQLILDLQDFLESLFLQTEAATDAVDYTLKGDIEYRLDGIKHMIQVYRDLQVLEPKQPTKANQVPSAQLNKMVPPIRLKKIVGFEEEAETLISYLMEETEELDVIPITGMPGIGKTTLAWKIYHHEVILSKFPTRIWVDIPLDFCSKDLYLIILKEFIKQGMVSFEELVMCLDLPRASCSKDSYLDILNEFTKSGRINDHQLLNAARACLQKSRFLLVMDDVWSKDTLESIRGSFPNMGKVLITSRNNHVTGKPHVLRFLNGKESWDLLQLEVFWKLGECPERLKSVVECISEKCEGLPLAIVAVGSSLGVTSSTVAAKYLKEKWWKKISENVMVHLADNVRQRIFSSVELSFSHLTECLQDCFLYLGVFPEGREIPVWILTRLWIAEGFVQGSRTMSMEETAENKLYQLIDRNLVIAGKIYPNGQIMTCRLHKVIHAFCKYKSAERDFYHDIKMSRGGDPISLASNHSRLCINYSHLSELLSNDKKGRYVRAIICMNKEEEVLHAEYSSTIRKSFESLRILECKCVRFIKFPRKLSKLMNLRYISLSCDDLDGCAIPEDISSLSYLETLVVNTQSDSLELKANIWRMFKLRHLVTKAAIFLAIRGTGEAGKNLQTLTRLAPECCTEDVFTRAPNLKTLGIRGSLAALSSAKFWTKMEHLQHLKLINESAPNSRLQHLLQPDCFPPNLKRLTLSATYLEWECMSLLGKINTLEILKLKNNAFIGRYWNTDTDGFRSLAFLFIGTSDLISWEAAAKCFPSLKCLVLKNCEKLEKIPLSLGKSLHTLDVENVSESAVESAKEIERGIVGAQKKGKMQDFKLSISD